MFENLKQKIHKKIEQGAIKSKLNGEVVYLKKSNMVFIGDWNRIYPPINEDGSWNLINLFFGGKKNLIKLLFILGVTGMVLIQFWEMFKYIDVLELRCPDLIIPKAKEFLQ